VIGVWCAGGSGAECFVGACGTVGLHVGFDGVDWVEECVFGDTGYGTGDAMVEEGGFTIPFFPFEVYYFIVYLHIVHSFVIRCFYIDYFGFLLIGI